MSGSDVHPKPKREPQPPVQSPAGSGEGTDPAKTLSPPSLMKILVVVFLAGAATMAVGAAGGAAVVWYLTSASHRDAESSPDQAPSPVTAPLVNEAQKVDSTSSSSSANLAQPAERKGPPVAVIDGSQCRNLVEPLEAILRNRTAGALQWVNAMDLEQGSKRPRVSRTSEPAILWRRDLARSLEAD